MIIKCVVAAHNAGGTPDFYVCRVECTDNGYAEGGHYVAAGRAAASEGYEDPMVIFDERDGSKFLFEHFNWDKAPIVKA